MYTEMIRKWATDLRHVGTLASACGVGEVGLGARQAGRQIAVRFALQLRDQSIETVRYQVYGCGYSMAACAAAAELVNHRSLDRAKQVTAKEIDDLLEGLPEDRKYCAELACQAVQAALVSIDSNKAVVRQVLARPSTADQGAKVQPDDPLYSALISSPNPEGAARDDRHLFACLLSIGRQEGTSAQGIGLDQGDLAQMSSSLFPRFDLTAVGGTEITIDPPNTDLEVLDLLLSYVPEEAQNPMPRLLAQALATRATHPGHLWVAMGLFERSQLTAAIERHLPQLAQANGQKMRWKKFFAKQICDAHGGTLCTAPTCGDCPEWEACFAPEKGRYQ